MTEREWLACEVPGKMLGHLKFGTTARQRKFLHFACACCRRIWLLIYIEAWRDVVEVINEFADGIATEEQVRLVVANAGNAYNSSSMAAEAVALARLFLNRGLDDVSHYAAQAVADQAVPDYPNRAGVWAEARRPEELAQCHLLRDIFGNPFRRIALAATHRTPIVVSLARAAYDERQLPSGELDPHMLAVLADALEETGAHGELVAHLRGPGPHVRGCHVVDLILGEE